MVFCIGVGKREILLLLWRTQLSDGLLLVLGGLAAGDAQRLPLAAAQVLGQQDDLADVVGVVRVGAVQRLDDGVWLSANRNRAREIFRLQGLERSEDDAPALFPFAHQFLAGWASGQL